MPPRGPLETFLTWAFCLLSPTVSWTPPTLGIPATPHLISNLAPKDLFLVVSGTGGPACGSTLPLLARFPVISWACMAGWLPCRTVGNGGGWCCGPLFLVFLDGPERPCQPSDPGTVNQQGRLHPGQRSSDAQPVGPSLPCGAEAKAVSKWALHKQPIQQLSPQRPAGVLWPGSLCPCAGHTERTALTH